MFTGIIQGLGRILSAQPAQVQWGTDQPGRGLRLNVAFGDLPADDVSVGDSIAINGACMTVVALTKTEFQVDVSAESLRCTTGLDQPGPVNLEKAMRAMDRLGGHLVSGHVDGRGRVLAVHPVGESWQLVVACPKAMAPFVSEKGSIAINGVSLTINTLSDSATEVEISVNLIPHTWQATTLQFLKPGSLVNIEVDQLARQVARVLERLHLAK
jgi:riboflavin synthase